MSVLALFILILPMRSAWADEALVSFSNGEQISKADLESYVSRRVDLVSTVRNFYGVESALREMAMTRVLVLEGIEKSVPRVAKAANERFDDHYAFTVYKTLVKTCVKPANAEEEKYYFYKNPEAFSVPASIRLSRIIL
ncbi:MAG: hypothetical protein ACTS6O_01345, partial [Giesbergeria sp.]